MALVHWCMDVFSAHSGNYNLMVLRLHFVDLNKNQLCTEKENISLHGIHDASVRYMRDELNNIGFKVAEGVSNPSPNV